VSIINGLVYIFQVYGKRAQWEDPTDWVHDTFPWGIAKEGEQILLKIRQEDVGYDSVGLSSSENNSPKIQTKSKEEITVQDSEGDSMVSDV
jgi:neuron navigator 2